MRAEHGSAPMDPAEIAEMRQAMLRMSSMQQEMSCLKQEIHSLRERMAAMEAQPSEESSVTDPTFGGCCEAGLAKQPMGTLMTMRSMLSETTTKHSLVESFWDATLFAGFEEVGVAASLMIFFGVTVSFLLQLVFCWVVLHFLLDLDFKYNLEYLWEWRVLYGHSVYGFDEASGSSLVSKVCKGRAFERAYWNNALIEEIAAYLDPAFSSSIPGACVGVVLCSVALTIWALFICAELQSVGSFARAICHLPRARGRTRVSMHKGTRVIESISCRRFVLLSFVILARFSIAVILGYSGGVWLCQTRDVTNIMLNAVALLFILDIDDMLYKVLAPKHAMNYLSSIQDIEVGSRKTWAGMDLSSLLKLLVLVVTVAIFGRYCIYENAQQARAAQELLCGGNRNFVYGPHPSLGPIFVTNTEEFDLTSARFNRMMPGMRGLVNDFVHNYNPDEVANNMWRHDLSPYGNLGVKYTKTVKEMRDWLGMSDQEASEQGSSLAYHSFGTTCTDQSWNKSYYEADWLWPTVKSITGGATNCQQAEAFCDDHDFPLVRMLCPQTCGCTRADSGLFVDNGCRKLCQKEDEFKKSLNETKICKESPSIHKSKVWNRWWKGFYDTNAASWGEDNPMVQFAKSAADGAPGNCSFITSESWIAGSFCRYQDGRRPGTLLCPVSCCRAEVAGDWCPTACS